MRLPRCGTTHEYYIRIVCYINHNNIASKKIPKLKLRNPQGRVPEKVTKSGLGPLSRVGAQWVLTLIIG